MRTSQIQEHSEICRLSPPSFADANATSPYHAGRGKGRLWGTPANPYCPVNFERKANLLQPFKRGDLQIWSTVTGGAYHSGRKVTMCVRNDYKVGTHLNCIRSTHQPRPSTLFSPIFSLAREKIGPPEACWKRFAGLCFPMGMPDPEKTYFDRHTGHSQWPCPVFCIIPSGSRIHSLLSWGIYCDHTQCGSSRNSPGWRT